MVSEILWKPTDKYRNHSKMNEFLSLIFKKYQLPDQEYHTVHRWSIDHPGVFWAEIWNFTHIRYSRNYDRVLTDPDKMPGARWFEGSRLNFAENLLRRNDNHTAIIFWGEDSVKREITYAELNEQVRLVASGFRKLGLKKGDRVAAFIPNIPEAIIAMLAAVSIGAIWSSTSPDFGIRGVLDRFSQIEPKIIIAADGYYYRGEVYDSQEKLRVIMHDLTTVEHVVIVSYTGFTNYTAIPNSISWDNLTGLSNDEMIFEQLPFNHPLYILYSSGTTGLPKSIVHSAGGTLVQHLKELILHTNLQEDDTIFYYTTCGWMMWNWLVSSLAVGATLVLYDGNPFYPGPQALLKMADELKVSIFGTSAKYIASLEESGVKPKDISDFKHLKVIASTGSPLTEESFRYIYRDWKKDIQLSSIAGGTDIISCFMLGNPVLPVYLGEIQCKGLGMDIDSFNENGKSVIGEQGELVCKTVFPSMPVYFWNDPEDKKYRSAYFDVYPGIWRHGDYVVISKHGGITMYGRSDATLNPQGVRIGTSEIYRVVEKLDEIADSVVVGKKTNGDEIVVLFVKLRGGVILDELLTKKIKSVIRSGCSPRHVPSIIKAVPDIPYTINGKKVELAVKNIIHGIEVKNRDVLVNPESLNIFAGILEQ